MPSVPREFRAAWVASVSNLHWPSKPGLSVKEQQDEALAILDILKQYHFNAVILQVRPQCDALYDSEYEPWSHFLTGCQGQPPQLYYDPLEFWIEQAHLRGLELHAWLNPYRAHAGGKVQPSDVSIVKTQPHLVKKLKNGMYWLNPTSRQVQDHSYNVVMDIVRRYDVDGIHFDDYFYPYPSYNAGQDFPDHSNWHAYQQSGGKLSREDWRRDAVNRFVRRVYKGIKKEKSYVKFGISPFGIWRPGHPASVEGLDQYNQLYADARLWLNKGWIDYWTPQLYWPIRKNSQSFPVLLNWWTHENKRERHIWPGINSTLGQAECINQIMIIRGMLANSPGAVHWHVNSITQKENKLGKALLQGPYAKQALVPTSPWLSKKCPARPSIRVEGDNQKKLIFSHPDIDDIASLVVYSRQQDKWQYEILGRYQEEYMLPESCDSSYLFVTAVDRIGNESKTATVPEFKSD